MPHLNVFIADLALITAVAAIVTLLFSKLKLPVVLGYIIAGFLISPNVQWLPTVVGIKSIETWANIGIEFLMLALGLEFGFRKIAKVGVSAVITAMTVMSGMMLAGYLVGMILRWSPTDCLFLGGMISISSTMIIKKISDEYRISNRKHTVLILGTLVIEDIFAVFLMILLAALAVSKETSGADMLIQIGSLILFLVFWLAVGIYLIPSLLKITQRFQNDESLLILTLAICFGMVMIFSYMGFSQALGAFIAGSILAGTVAADKIEKLIRPLKDLFGAIFFVSVGMLVSPNMFVEHLGPILLISVVTIFGQLFFTTIGILLSGQSFKTAVSGGFFMVQIGEFSFIIASMGNTLAVTSDHLFPIIVCVAVITILFTPLFIANGERFAEFLEPHLPKRFLVAMKRYSNQRETVNSFDEDWKKFFAIFLARVFICSGGLLLIYVASVRWVEPFIEGYINPQLAGLATTVLTIVAMIPVISILWSRRGHLYAKLWLKNKGNRLPLLVLHGVRIIIAIFFVVLSFSSFLDWPNWLLLTLAALIVLFTIRSDFLKGQSIKIEARFIANFNEKLLHHLMEERKVIDDEHWLGDKVSVVEFTVTDTGKYRTINDLYDSRVLNLLIVKIIRRKRHILMPDLHQPLRDGDVIHVIGSKTHLDAYLFHLKSEDNLILSHEHRSTLKEYTYGQVFKDVDPKDQIICSAIQTQKDSTFAKKPIKTSGFRRRYQGSIIAIERGTLPIIAPRVNTIIEPGDVLWVVGTETMAKRLLVDGLLKG
jgi:monovalent cation:H+ antiporter-2, CPA2 family